MATKKKDAVVEEVQQEIPEVQSELGGALKAAREAQKMSIKDVCSSLHLNEKQVMAMEQDDFAILDSPTRARGFIRSYARLLSLDEEVLLNKHRQLFPSEVLSSINVTTETLAKASKYVGIPKYFLVVGALILLTSLVWFLTTINFRGSSEESSVETAQEAMPEVALPASERTQGDAAKALVDEIQLPQPSVPAPAAAESPKVEPAKPSVVSPAVPPAATDKVSANAGNLKFVVTENTWVDVKDNSEKTIFTKVLKPGVDEVIQAATPLKVHLGNVKGVQLIYNGKPVDYSANIHGNTARVTLGAE